MLKEIGQCHGLFKEVQLMTRRMLTVAFCWLAGAASLASAQTTLPLVEGVELGPFREHLEQLGPAIIRVLEPDDFRALTQLMLETGRLIRAKDPKAAEFIEKAQKILDPYCLVGVSINPESRVKAARGPREAELVRGRERFVLVKVQNEAGVTQGLKVAGEQLRTAKEEGKGRWLEASIDFEKLPEDKLSGQKLDYVVLRLKAHEAGKREAVLKFDVGQGTQDLGFRAEVPILFNVKDSK
jgi:hypothetical protein